MTGPGPLPHVLTGGGSMLSLSPRLGLGSEHQVLNCSFSAAAAAAAAPPPGLAVPEGNPAPATTGVSFQATQDIFSFCFPVFLFLDLPFVRPPSPSGTPMRVEFRGSPMGTVPFLKCQCWGISVASEAHLRFGDPPVPMISVWGIPWEPSFEAPAPFNYP